MKIKMILASAAALFFWLCSTGPSDALAGGAKAQYLIIASDTLLSGMAETLLPAPRYSVEAILPPGQCPGHYDVKLSDVEKVQKADLVISFSHMTFMEKANTGGTNRLMIDNDRRNWMVPDSYIYGLNRIADELVARFPADRKHILQRKEASILLISGEADKLRKKAWQAGLPGRAVLASSMQKEPLEWMGLSIAGVYGRPESISARDVVRLVREGRDARIIAVVDNLQSGPEVGKRLAETLGRPHIVMSNFPSEHGYLETLRENVETVLTALERK